MKTIELIGTRCVLHRPPLDDLFVFSSPQQGQEIDVGIMLEQQAIDSVDELESGESTRFADDIKGQSIRD